MNSDFRDLLSALNAHETRYLVVGGYAVVFHAEPRFTADLDIWTEPTPQNALRLMRAFSDFGLPLINIRPEDFESPGVQYQIGMAPCAIDFLTSVPGVEFESAWLRRCVVDDDGLRVNYLSRDDLIQAKRTSGRPKDLVDLECLLDEDLQDRSE